MQILGIVLSVVAFLLATFFALGLNLLDEERDRYYSAGGQKPPDFVKMTPWGLLMMWALPLLPLRFMTNIFDDSRLWTWSAGVAWVVFLVVVFFASRRYVFRPLVRQLDERRNTETQYL